MRAGRFFAMAATAAAMSLAGHTGVSAEEWRFAHEEGQGDVQDLYAQEFKRLVEERTNGEVTVTIYTYGQLGNENDITELTASGAVQFSNASPGHLGTFVPEVQVLSIPYLLSDNPEVNKDVLNNSEALYEDLAEDFRDKGLRLYSIYPEGEMVWTTKKPVDEPTDLNGVKFRVMTSPILVEAYEAFGADPVALPWGEVYSGLQLNIIDAQVNPIFFIESAKFYEVTDYLIWTGEQEYTTTVVANADFWEGLSDEREAMLLDIRSELADFIYEKQREANEAAKQRIKEQKPSIEFITLTPEQREAFKKRAEPLDEKLVQMVGGDTGAILEKLRAEIAAKEEELATQ